MILRRNIMDLAQTLGWIATFLFSIMVIPQIIKTYRSKDTSGVSLAVFVIYLNANIIALIYAFMIKQQPLIIKYIVAIITTVIYIIIFWYYYRRKNIENKIDIKIDKKIEEKIDEKIERVNV